MQDKLGAFLADAAGRTLEYGVFDCGLWLADWYMLATGKPDPAAGLRGRGIEHPRVILHTIRRHLWLERTRAPQRGDVGLISLAKGHLVGAIFNGWHWIILMDDGGISAIPRNVCRFQAAWRVA